MEPKSTALKLPTSLISRSEANAILRELNSLEDFFVSAGVRQGGTPIQPPRITRMLDSLARENKYNLLDASHRTELTTALKQVLAKAPQMQISFASEPSPKAMERLVVWFRSSIHPQAMLSVGLRPNIAAGCVLMTPNKVFDMSLKSYLTKQEPYLVELIKGAMNAR